ncbi:unnamed protein product, partial [Phaeothamnion confervicola]
QVTLGGAVHSLEPLRFAFPRPNQAVVFAEPTVFLGALWLPHDRDPQRMAVTLAATAAEAAAVTEPGAVMSAGGTAEAAAAAEGSEAAAADGDKVIRAIFCHADVRGAITNGGSGSRAFLGAGAFPAGIPIYSGHYHKPHIVGGSQGRDAAATGRVRYVGSPYQTTLAEAGQQKALLVLSARTWQDLDVIPLALGRRHFRLFGAAAAAGQNSTAAAAG